MMERLLARLQRSAIVAAMAAAVLTNATQATAQPQGPALTRADFARADTLDKIPLLPPGAYPHGFGDRQNSWAWGMEWFNGKLYVATNRSYNCMVSASINRVFPTVAYPPNDPDLECAPNPHDLGLQAEIWSWNPGADQWTRVFQSPRDLRIPQSDPLNPKFVARDVGFRGLFGTAGARRERRHHLRDVCLRRGAELDLPAASWRADSAHDRWRELHAYTSDSGTFLGNLANASFRGMAEHAGKLYAVAGGIQGDGILINPASRGSAITPGESPRRSKSRKSRRSTVTSTWASRDRTKKDSRSHGWIPLRCRTRSRRS